LTWFYQNQKAEPPGHTREHETAYTRDDPCVSRHPAWGQVIGFTRVGFFTAPPPAAEEEGKSGGTPETPPGAAPLDPAHNKSTRVKGNRGR